MAVRTFAVYVSVAVLPFSFLKAEETCCLVVLIHVIVVFFLSCFKIAGQTAIEKENYNDKSKCIENAVSCHNIQYEKSKVNKKQCLMP